jgi:putative flippase GtrA
MQTPLHQFLSFAGVGAIGTAAHYAVLILLVEAVDLNVPVSSTCGFVVGAIVNYYCNYRFTFMSTRQHREAVPRFAAVAAAGAVMNSALMYGATRLLEIHYLYSQIAVTALVLLFNFTANRYWTFSELPRRIRDS